MHLPEFPYFKTHLDYQKVNGAFPCGRCGYGAQVDEGTVERVVACAHQIPFHADCLGELLTNGNTIRANVCYLCNHERDKKQVRYANLIAVFALVVAFGKGAHDLLT